MSPKERAKKLFARYSEVFLPIGIGKHHLIKEAAEIAVDEIIKIVPSVYLTDDIEIHSGHRQYWEQVKAEIESL